MCMLGNGDAAFGFMRSYAYADVVAHAGSPVHDALTAEKEAHASAGEPGPGQEGRSQELCVSARQIRGEHCKMRVVPAVGLQHAMSGTSSAAPGVHQQRASSVRGGRAPPCGEHGRTCMHSAQSAQHVRSGVESCTCQQTWVHVHHALTPVWQTPSSPVIMYRS
jgi:hypothetical protein